MELIDNWCIEHIILNDESALVVPVARCCVVATSGSKLDLSLRRSRTGEAPTDLVQTDDTDNEDEGEMGVSQGSCDPEITSLQDLDVGKIVRGYVKAVTDVGAFVR